MVKNIRLKNLRETLELTQKEFGEKLNLSSSQISSYESGHRCITERTLNDIYRIFRVNKDWMIEGKGNMFIDVDTVEDLSTKIMNLPAKDRDAIIRIVDALILSLEEN